ncbi:uncharacterized protein LOC124310175 [Neodiprion virginianus]|uniref:uncharacterized protein LOC124310175 n=1 Tax=Neodiprion virginianus TaxID=2961670 RepID=UPI001EE6B038|nr:uncharacterized protein LOC124310175 [Neodiprion virginianus]
MDSVTKALSTRQEAEACESKICGNTVSPAWDSTNTKSDNCAMETVDSFNAKNTGDMSYLLPSKPKLKKSVNGSAGKPKRKSRTARRRLNAQTNNASLHFSDTDSEGELVLLNPRSVIVVPSRDLHEMCGHIDMPNPTISVTTDELECHGTNANDIDLRELKLSTPNQSRRQSFVENLTDCDDIYSSEPEVLQNDGDSADAANELLKVINCSGQLRETDCEDLSIDGDDCDEDYSGRPIYVPIRTDILADLNGERITTKEGDGPFSIEVRNQLSFDEGAAVPINTGNRDHGDDFVPPPVITATGTDSEDMDASDEEDAMIGTRRTFDEIFQDLDTGTTSQIVVRNLNMIDEAHHRLGVNKPVIYDGTADGHTDVEDIE